MEEQIVKVGLRFRKDGGFHQGDYGRLLKKIGLRGHVEDVHFPDSPRGRATITLKMGSSEASVADWNGTLADLLSTRPVNFHP